MLRKKKKDPDKGKNKSTEIPADRSLESFFAGALINEAVECGAAHEALAEWREKVEEAGIPQSAKPVVFVTDPQDSHGAAYLSRTWGQAVLDDLLEEIRVTGQRRIFTAAMHKEFAEAELPFEDLREAISGDPPEGCSAWIFGVGGERYVLSGLPALLPDSN